MNHNGKWLMLLLLSTTAASAADRPAQQAPGVPALWGYGMKSCGEFLAAAPADALSLPLAGEEYRRYQEWLAGLVTGLNLTTGRDVLRDAELTAAMVRIRALCAAHPDEDFFNASVRLIRALGQLKAQ
ncbi:hypothetical protein CKO12_03160 [Chromatium okenii]|uniref:hypothetical protein n=1 Tax=Chromatium okenii TaxID=61644 RepID=UPI0019061BD3|nr:hypothetical protein [Chromatium okenii]MBK1640891.1 hypothetical protein [Chromatium okenii]